jgi:MFS family permease
VGVMEKEEPQLFSDLPGKGNAQAFAMLNTGNAIGLLLGPSYAGTLVDRYGWAWMTVGLSMLTLVGALPTIILVSRPIFQTGKRD